MTRLMMKRTTCVGVFAFVTSAVFPACGKGPASPSAIEPSPAARADQVTDPAAGTVAAGGPQNVDKMSSGSLPSAITIPNLTLPKPVLSMIFPTSAAPGTVISVFGKDLNPQGPLVFVRPAVVFAGRPGYFSQSAQFVSNSELRVVVPPGNGIVDAQVQTAGGTSANMRFTYKSPTITSISPASAPRGQVVTLSGTGFGIKQGLDPSRITFGGTVAQGIQWTDQRITVKAPMDFGTGLNDEILLGLGGCVAGFGAETLLEKWIIKFSLPGCVTLVKDLFNRFQLSQNPGFVTRPVSVTVRTSAGVSNGRTFTYTVQTETR
jgi:IPT/TIG domain